MGRLRSLARRVKKKAGSVLGRDITPSTARDAAPEPPAPAADEATPWYMSGDDLDGWEDTNANDEKKAEAAESAARAEQDEQG